jgi:hypothetical protein
VSLARRLALRRATCSTTPTDEAVRGWEHVESEVMYGFPCVGTILHTSVYESGAREERDVLSHDVASACPHHHQLVIEYDVPRHPSETEGAVTLLEATDFILCTAVGSSVSQPRSHEAGYERTLQISQHVSNADRTTMMLQSTHNPPNAVGSFRTQRLLD